MFLFISCSTLFEMDEPCECGLNITSELPMVNGVYHLPYNNNLSMTYSHLYAETSCGLHTRISWDSDYMYEIVEGQWTSLINPASMTNEDGKGTIVYGVWEDLIGSTITFYGGYFCDENENHMVKMKI
jgi:hypothetical protein